MGAYRTLPFNYGASTKEASRNPNLHQNDADHAATLRMHVITCINHLISVVNICMNYSYNKMCFTRSNNLCCHNKL
jgi:hypothetical protein